MPLRWLSLVVNADGQCLGKPRFNDPLKNIYSFTVKCMGKWTMQHKRQYVRATILDHLFVIKKDASWIYSMHITIDLIPFIFLDAYVHNHSHLAHKHISPSFMMCTNQVLFNPV